MDLIKKSFQKVREDMLDLRKELGDTKKELENLKEFIESNLLKNSTQNTSNKTEYKRVPTDKGALEGLKAYNLGISIGNGGVPTDRQTDRQTDRHISNQIENKENIIQKKESNTEDKENLIKESKKFTLDNAVEILDSLDAFKKQIRLKFKRLTEQEFLVFSTLYQLETEEGYTNYKSLSKKLNLSESSIRDYVGRLIIKGVPIEKSKINNKNIHLKISENLKKIATLSTIINLRDL